MAFIEFDTRNHFPHERADAARETCAAMANMAPDIADDGNLSLSMRIRLLPGVAVAAVECSPLSVSRSVSSASMAVPRFAATRGSDPKAAAARVACCARVPSSSRPA